MFLPFLLIPEKIMLLMRPCSAKLVQNADQTFIKRQIGFDLPRQNGWSGPLAATSVTRGAELS